MLVAKSVKTEFLSTDITLKTPDGRIAAILHRPAFNFPTDSWQVTSLNRDAVDSRLIVMIGAYKTSVDNVRASSSSSSSDDDSDDSESK